jgi:predicted kinase
MNQTDYLSNFKIESSKKRIVILKGLPGSGKSTFGRTLSEQCAKDSIKCLTASADDFFMDNGEYKFDQSKIKDAHEECYQKYYHFFRKDINLAIIDNTNLSRWERKRYIKLAQKNLDKIDFIDIIYFPCSVENSFKRNTHNVPLEVIQNMEKRIQQDNSCEIYIRNFTFGEMP